MYFMYSISDFNGNALEILTGIFLGSMCSFYTLTVTFIDECIFSFYPLFVPRA